MVVARRSGVALWRQVQVDLETQIGNGTYRPGDRLPTEAQLSEHFQVNRHTVRRALAGLEERGLIRVEQGRGTFVQEPVLSYRIGQRTRFSENARTQNRRPSRQLLDIGSLPAEDEVAAALGLSRGAPVVYALVAGEIDGTRIVFGEHFFPAARLPHLAEALRETTSVTQALARVGVDDYRRLWTRVIARMPSGREAATLSQARSRPVLVATSLNVDAQGAPLEYCVARFHSDWVELVFEP
jgi:GntR family phosphonate transport system transcriptional regulator